jgi:radical SAM protein with 4Fe4S-binding SPASM domain
MKPFVHTNGDVLRNSQDLCKEATEVFEYIVVGLYDYKTEEEKQGEKEFWKKRLKGTQVMFSLVENVYVRTHSPCNAQMSTIIRQTHPNKACAQPKTYLLIHYNGDVACCCEDMYGELLRMNIFETSIRKVWYSEHHARLITALEAGDRNKYALCANCTMGPSHYSSNPMEATDHLDK